MCISGYVYIGLRVNPLSHNTPISHINICPSGSLPHGAVLLYITTISHINCTPRYNFTTHNTPILHINVCPSGSLPDGAFLLHGSADAVGAKSVCYVSGLTLTLPVLIVSHTIPFSQLTLPSQARSRTVLYYFMAQLMPWATDSDDTRAVILLSLVVSPTFLYIHINVCPPGSLAHGPVILHGPADAVGDRRR